jgi:hypothetical protein
MTTAALTLGGLATASADPRIEASAPGATLDTPAMQPQLSGKAAQHARAMQAQASAQNQTVAPEEAVAGMGVVALVLLLAL